MKMVHDKYLLKWKDILSTYTLVEKEKQLSGVTLPLTRDPIP